MNVFAIIGIIIAFFASAAGIFVFIGYAEELNLVDRLCEYGAKLARKRKRR